MRGIEREEGVEGRSPNLQTMMFVNLFRVLFSGRRAHLTW